MRTPSLLTALATSLPLAAGIAWQSPAGLATPAISVTPIADTAVQINVAGIPATSMREFSTIWRAGDPLAGTIFFTQSATSPLSISRAVTCDGGVTWTAGVDTGLLSPVSPSLSADERNPVVRDFDGTGDLVGFFGSRQGVSVSFNELLFRAASAAAANGAAWSAESLVTFLPETAFAGHTGLNGFIEVFRTTTGVLRGYTAMNNITGSPASATHVVESLDGGLTWTDLGNIQIPGPGGAFNIVSANSPVFTFTDTTDNQARMGWFVFGEGGGNRGVTLLISANEGLSWTPAGFSFLDANIRSGDAHFLADSLVRLFYHVNPVGTGSRQFWREDFTLSGMSDIQPNNLFAGPSACNNPPVALCKDVTVSADGACLAAASIDDGSFDPDDDPITLVQSPPGPYGLGTTDVTLIVTDSHDASSSCTATVTVVDDTPPALAASVATGCLWPPNHDLVDVGLSYSASDNCTAPTLTFTVTSDEPADHKTGDGRFSPDAVFVLDEGGQVVGLRLRAERRGDGDGRVYHIAIVATDEAGNVASQILPVGVPKDQRTRTPGQTPGNDPNAACTAVDSRGPEYVVTSPPALVVGPKQ